MKKHLKTRITLRIDPEINLNLEIMKKATNASKGQIIRMIIKDFFTNNDNLLNQYYEKQKNL